MKIVKGIVIAALVYVAANHWPRAWYHRLLANPDVRVTIEGATGNYRAVEVASGGEEHVRVANDNPVPGWFRFVTGFPPRYFIRLEPRA